MLSNTEGQERLATRKETERSGNAPCRHRYRPGVWGKGRRQRWAAGCLVTAACLRRSRANAPMLPIAGRLRYLPVAATLALPARAPVPGTQLGGHGKQLQRGASSTPPSAVLAPHLERLAQVPAAARHRLGHHVQRRALEQPRAAGVPSQAGLQDGAHLRGDRRMRGTAGGRRRRRGMRVRSLTVYDRAVAAAGGRASTPAAPSRAGGRKQRGC
jgi:hypothetical protein